MKKTKIMCDKQMTKYGEENDSNVYFLASNGWLRDL